LEDADYTAAHAQFTGHIKTQVNFKKRWQESTIVRRKMFDAKDAKQ